MATDSNLPIGSQPEMPPQERPVRGAHAEPETLAVSAAHATDGASATGIAEPSKPKRLGGLYVALAVAVVAVLALSLALLRTCTAEQGARDPNAALGQLEGKSEEEIQAELNRIVEEGMFNVSISSVVEFADGASQGDLCIENVPGNLYLMQVAITRDDTGEQIYQTGLIDPNHHIQSDALDVDLDAGEYACTATFFASDVETEELVGQAAVKMTIKVLG